MTPTMSSGAEDVETTQQQTSKTELEPQSSNTSNNDQGLLNRIFRRRSSATSRKSEDLTSQKDNLMAYLSTTNKSSNTQSQSQTQNPPANHSRSNSSNNPCHRLSFQVGVCENKNTKYRPTMEDVHTYVANFAERLDWGYFAVFDGHAGKQAARWCGSNLHSIIEKNILKNDNLDLRINLNNSFIESDEIMKDDCNGSSGCTAAVAIIRWEESDNTSSSTTSNSSPLKLKQAAHNVAHGVLPQHQAQHQVDAQKTPFDFIPTSNHRRMLYTANVGDSRLVLSRAGKALRLSHDHKGSDQTEQERIIKSGGVILKSRVNGMLAVTRSLGDTYMKDLVIGNPYTTATEITADDEFLIIACDGLWDVCTDQRAIDLIRDIKDVNRAAKVLCNYAMESMTTDNVTVMVVRLDGNVFKHTVQQASASASKNNSKNSKTTGSKTAVSDNDEIAVTNSDQLVDGNPNTEEEEAKEKGVDEYQNRQHDEQEQNVDDVDHGVNSLNIEKN